MQLEIKQQIELYNQSVKGLNDCWRSLQLSEHQLPVIERQEMIIKSEVNRSSNGSPTHLGLITATTDI